MTEQASSHSKNITIHLQWPLTGLEIPTSNSNMSTTVNKIGRKICRSVQTKIKPPSLSKNQHRFQRITASWSVTKQTERTTRTYMTPMQHRSQESQDRNRLPTRRSEPYLPRTYMTPMQHDATNSTHRHVNTTDTNQSQTQTQTSNPAPYKTKRIHKHHNHKPSKLCISLIAFLQKNAPSSSSECNTPCSA